MTESTHFIYISLKTINLIKRVHGCISYKIKIILFTAGVLRKVPHFPINFLEIVVACYTNAEQPLMNLSNCKLSYNLISETIPVEYDYVTWCIAT